MERTQLEELAMGYISDLVDQLAYLQSQGDTDNMAVVHAKIKDLTRALDSEDAADNFFWVRDYKHLH